MGYDADGWSIQESTSKNSNLTKAKAAKNDEFYTQYSDIEAELSHYDVKHFEDRVVYLPCDDWHFSQFVKYFEDNFTRLQLKALVATGINFSGSGYYYKKTSEGVTTGVLDCNGDFRSDACRQLMKEADIIVTNPPFSLFREFIAQIMEFRKKFLVIGNMNAVNYLTAYIKQGKMSVSINAKGGTRTGNSLFFTVPDTYDGRTEIKNGLRMVQTTSWWFTNLEFKEMHEPLTLNETYSPAKYPKYDNYDAIECSRSELVPSDYFGIIGVPISFLKGFYCPDQFEIVGTAIAGYYDKDAPYYKPIPSVRDGGAAYLNGKRLYARILIKRKTIPVEAE